MRPHATSMVVILILATVVPTGLASAQSSTSGDTFYFHLQSETYRNANESITVLDEANLAASEGSTPRVFEVAASIRNATTIFGTVWVGSIGWVTEPLTANATFDGTATFTVWLSGSEVNPTFSGVGAGIAILNQQNQTVGNYHYSFTYAHGNAVTSTPALYSFSVRLNEFASVGQRLVFAVGVGSTTEGWRVNVFFDDAQYSSRVQLPTNITVVREFEPAGFFVTILIAMAVSLSLLRRMPRCRKAKSCGRSEV